MPLLGHGLRLGLGEEVDDVEKTERDSDELGHLEGDLDTLTLGGLGTGSVGTEGNPVSCKKRNEDISSRYRR